MKEILDILAGLLAIAAAAVPLLVQRRRRQQRTLSSPHPPPAPQPLSWPSSTDYSAAVSIPQAFVDPELRAGMVSTVMGGLPGAVRGQSAVVFRLEVGDRAYAIRCFLAEPHDGVARYRALEEHLRLYPCADVVSPRWVDDGIIVGDRTWPIVVMPWIVEPHLDTTVDNEREAPDRLRELAEQWRATVERLDASGLVHGDLQHGNVLVSADDLSMKLIDLDGAWVPGGNAAAPFETGHPHYQHPRRNRSHWGPGIDSFSALLIYLSLRALAVDPSLLWFSSSESLVFVRDDLLRPGRTPVWARLEQSPDPEVQGLAALLAELCRAPEPPRQPLGVHLMRAAQMARPAAREAPSRLSLPAMADDNWWQQPNSPQRVTWTTNDAAVLPPLAGDAWWEPPRPPAADDGTAVGS